MSLPDLTALKARLRIETDVEDDDLALMRESGIAFIEESVGRPIYATQRTWVLEKWVGAVRSDRLFLPMYPVRHDDTVAVTITDADGDAVTDFRVNTQMGMIVATVATVWSNYPYTVVATVGLELLDGFNTRVEPKLAQALLDLCADWYQRRNPAALAEGAGGGVITQWQSLGVPARICEQLDAYRLVKAY